MSDHIDNYYAILDIEPGADSETIEAAIKAARKRWRQQQGSPDQERRSLAEQRMSQLEAARDILLDANRRAQYDVALTQQLSAVPEAVQESGTNWGERAKQYYNDGDIRNAFTAAKKGTDVDSENVTTWMYYVLAAQDLKRWEDADFASAELVNRLPRVHSSHDLRGGVLDRMGRYKEAEISFRKAASLEPSSAYYHGRAAWAVLDQGRIDDAITEANDIAARFPDDDYPLRVLRAAAAALREKKRYLEALALSRQLLSVNADDGDAMTEAVLAVQELASARDFGNACPAMWDLLNAYPQSEDTQRLARYVIVEMRSANLYADALTWSRSVLERYPHDPEMKRTLAFSLIAEAESKMAQTSPTTHTIVNKSQANYMTRALNEAEALQVSDPGALSAIRNAREFLTSQTKTKVSLGFGKIVLGVLAIVFGLFLGLFRIADGGFVFLLIGALLGWWFWVVAFPKQYRLNYKAQSPEVRKSGLQK